MDVVVGKNDIEEAISTSDSIATPTTTLKTIISNSETKILKPSPQTSIITEKDVYKMTSVPRGFCILINNYDFSKKADNNGKSETLSFREGSQVEAQRLSQVFQNLAFQVI